MRNCWTATSYAEYHRNGCTHAAYSPGCRPLGSHSRLATTPSTMPRRLHRYKTLPARAPRGRYRYKTLPARPKYLFSAHFAPAGRTLYRFHHHQAEQGEFSTAYGTTYGTKLSRHAPPSAHPVQNSPSTPETPLFGAFCASRESFIPLPPPPSRAGRIFCRIRNHLRYKTLPTRAPGGPPGTKLSRHARNTPFRRILRQQGEFYTASTTTKPSRENFVPHTEPPTVQNSPRSQPRQAHPVQNSPDTQPRRPTRYKTLPARPKYPSSAHFAPAGRVLYRVRHHQTKQGEKSHARAAPRGAGQALTTPGTP